MTVEEEMILCKVAHLQKIENDPANIARIALKQLETNPNIKRTIDELKSLPKSPHDDAQDAMAQAMAGQAVFHPDSPFVSIEARSHVNTIPEIPHVDIPNNQDCFLMRRNIGG